jgi:hypothetical protein
MILMVHLSLNKRKLLCVHNPDNLFPERVRVVTLAFYELESESIFLRSGFNFWKICTLHASRKANQTTILTPSVALKIYSGNTELDVTEKPAKIIGNQPYLVRSLRIFPKKSKILISECFHISLRNVYTDNFTVA